MKDIKRYLFIMAAFAAVCGFVACGDGGGGGSSDGGSVRAQYGPADDGTTITFYRNNTFRLVEASGTSTRAADSEGEGGEGSPVTITEGRYTGNPVTGDGLACTSSDGKTVTVTVSSGSATVNSKKLTKAEAVYENNEDGIATCTFFSDKSVIFTVLSERHQAVHTGTYEGNPLQGEVKVFELGLIGHESRDKEVMTITDEGLTWDGEKFTRIYP